MKRKVVALALLIALFGLTLTYRDAYRETLAAGSHTSVTAPAWGVAFGISDGWALVLGVGAAITCAGFVGPTAIACGSAATF